MTDEERKALALRKAELLEFMADECCKRGPLSRVMLSFDEARALASMLREVAEGQPSSTLTFIYVGWRDFEGQNRLQGIVEFPDGPPSITLKAIWNRWPARFSYPAAPPPPAEEGK